MRNPFRPIPAPPAFGAGKVVPEQNASILSRLVFHWLSPFLDVGFSRPLQKDDFWELPQERLTGSVTDSLETNFYSRCPPEKRPESLRDSLKAPEDADASSLSEKEGPEVIGTTAVEDSKSSPYDSSLIKALHTTFFYSWWTAGVLQLLSDTLKTTTPLLNKVLLTWLTEAYVWYRLDDQQRLDAESSGLISKPQGIGYGIGLGIALFAMQQVSSLMANHCMQIGMRNGLLVRSSIIGNIFRKSLRLSGRARLEHSVGQITTMISTDTARFDVLTHLGHHLWVSPIQIIIGFGLLLGTLGYSALVGAAVLLVALPFQGVLVKVMFDQRAKGVKITDSRVRLTTEVLQGIRLVKFYGWEQFYITKIEDMRKRELRAIRISSIAAAVLLGLFISLPTIATIMSFITYSLTGHDLNIAIIFTSLQFFNIIRAPLVLFPMVLSLLADSLVALGRISSFLTAEELGEPYRIDTAISNAIDVDGDFTWETAGKPDDVKKTTTPADEDPIRKAIRIKEEKKKAKEEAKGKKKGGLPTAAPVGQDDSDLNKKEEEQPFQLKDLKLGVKRGSFVGIVGRVGSGKSSILQALIGEMRKTRGEVTFGGSVAYVSQTSWIRNTTLRKNITFGQEDDEDKFREVIKACSLEHDLEILPHGEETEIGEKGINLSGGQKARISLARAAYSSSDIILLDDPLSAVDAHVGKSITDDCLLSGPLAQRTRVLVTHALHVLNKTDWIYVVENGIIKEQGTYQTLMKDSTAFSRVMDEYGSSERQVDPTKVVAKAVGPVIEAADKPLPAALMQEEDRETGSVSWNIYRKYLQAAGGSIWIFVLITLAALYESASVGNNVLLGFWTSESIKGFQQRDYMALYAGLGVAQAFFSFLLNLAFTLIGLFASLNLFKGALGHVLRSPMSFFDTTPMGRILSRLSKDQDTLDSELPMVLMQGVLLFGTVLGTVGLVFYTFPYLGIIFVPLTVLYGIAAVYYRRTSVETKRLDSLMRSALYASYSETLTGLATIRAYQVQVSLYLWIASLGSLTNLFRAIQSRCVTDAEQGLDLENRAYYMTISIQRWLAIRLDFFGNVLILGIALFAAGYRFHVNPSKTGVILSYTLGITQVFSELVNMFAMIEQSMNAVERILVYSELPPEHTESPITPPPSWPDKGEIQFKNVQMSYREGLPLVLKDLSFHIKAGEKVGIVGRTGAGKSSLLQAIFRTVELHHGSIEVDGLNVSNIALDTLRGRLALVPQDTTMFLGTLRDNLDPQKSRTDAELISMLQRAWLLPQAGESDPVAEAKFSLDSVVGDEGGNFSIGERQLLALSRALVKNSRIIILDEATSSVDVETDAKIQRTIQTEFAERTLLCIAHRLNTIAYYDRVIVMDSGQVAEFDTVLSLFDKSDSIFRSLCDGANLQRSDIIRIRAEYKEVVGEASS